MKSPWTQVRPPEPGVEYLVFASLIPPRSRRSTWRLFRGSNAVAAQLRRADGIVGFSMLARPLRKQYATLSLWVDEAALKDFATSTPHAELMAALGPEMAQTRFVRWTVSATDGRPGWGDALARLERGGP